MIDYMYLKAHPGDDGVLSVNIERVPRWKESELSGDEWRFSLSGVIRYKDWSAGGVSEVVLTGYSLIDISIKVAAWLNEHRTKDLHPPFTVKEYGEIKACFQPGCAEEPENAYRIKQEWSWHPHQGHRMEARSSPVIRAFCGIHSHRGDCALEDADSNYEWLAFLPVGLAGTLGDTE